MRDTQDFALTLKHAEVESGLIEGYGAVYHTEDRDGDIIAPGAFRDSLALRTPLMLWQHSAKEPIGVWEEVREDASGLYLKGRLAREGRGREAMELVKMGALTGLSVGFVTKDASRDPQTGVRTIHRAELYEVSLVTFPANEGARIASIKSAAQITTLRELEGALREAGASREAAKAACANFVAKCDLQYGGAGVQEDFGCGGNTEPVSDLNAALTAARYSLSLLEGTTEL